jgi:hypothetical protein
VEPIYSRSSGALDSGDASPYGISTYLNRGSSDTTMGRCPMLAQLGGRVTDSHDPKPRGMKHILAIGGLPGAGKSTLAALLSEDHLYAADDYFTLPTGEYNFDPTKLPQAHAQCQDNVRNACEAGAERVIVHNTFSNRWEAEPYRAIAEEYGYAFFSVTLGDSSIPLEDLASRNTHEVPLERLEAMANGDAMNLTADSDTRPPWERD